MNTVAPLVRRRTALVVCLIFLIYIVAICTPNKDSLLRWSDRTGASQVSASGGEAQLAEDVHRLPTANAFLPHLRAVTRLPGITVDEARSGCNWTVADKVHFQFDAEAEWARQDRSVEETEIRRVQWHDFLLTQLLPFDDYKGRFEGRGLVIVAGDSRRVAPILRALRKLGSTIPVELHHWRDEMTNETRSDLSSIGPLLHFQDLSESTHTVQTGVGIFKDRNYQLKTAAILNSRFAEPLLLDSDNIPVIDPELLYESSTYKEFGTLFWPDISRSRPNNPMWSITNTQCRMDEYEQESGQLLVDKRKYFYHLQLAHWFNNAHGDYYNNFLLGDKDMFRFAWHALKTKYGAPQKWVTSVGTLNDGFYCGHSFAQHHSDDSRIAFMHSGLLKTMAKPVVKWQRETQGGVFQVYKRSESDEQPAVNVENEIYWDNADYLPSKPEGVAVGMCTNFNQVEARPLAEVAPGFEELFEEIGGYWMLDEEE